MSEGLISTAAMAVHVPCFGVVLHDERERRADAKGAGVTPRRSGHSVQMSWHLGIERSGVPAVDFDRALRDDSGVCRASAQFLEIVVDYKSSVSGFRIVRFDRFRPRSAHDRCASSCFAAKVPTRLAY